MMPLIKKRTDYRPLLWLPENTFLEVLIFDDFTIVKSAITFKKNRSDLIEKSSLKETIELNGVNLITNKFLLIIDETKSKSIKIDNLSDVDQAKKEAKKDKIFSYSIKIADFYYKDSANNMSDRIINETNIKNPFIKTISNTKYRVLLGPFNDIKKLEDSFNEIKSLDFENIEILKNV